MLEQSERDGITVGGLQRKVEALNRLVEVSLVMNSTLARQPLLKFIMDAATEITGAERASILLVSKNPNALSFAASTDADADELAGIAVPIEGSIAGAIISYDKALVIDDVTQDPRHFRGVDRQIAFQTRSLLGVPMRIKERLVGVLEVLNKKQGNFDEEDVRHITILASQAAVAIENAGLISALRQANEELSKLDKLKSDFIAIASHELRTPLGIILGYASFLKEEAEGTASEHAEAVLSSALHLRSLIEAMTNLRYVQIDKSELTIQEVPLNLILRGAYADVQSLAETRRHAVTLALPEREIQVRADLHMMTMALTNVLNNAVKFTPEGGEIAVSVEEHPSEVWIRVRDTGVGLAADQLDLIFDQFYQVEDPMTRQHEGLGLGLSISRAIVERHGGRIWAESAGPGRGSLFTLTIPLAGAP